MFLAEIGDKTNILLLSLLSKYKHSKSVIGGGFSGIVIVTIIGAVIGSFLSSIHPDWIIPLLSGLVFLWLGISEFVGEEEIKEESGITVDDTNELSSMKIFLKSLSLIGLAEFGDKSQIFVISSSAIQDPVAVALGAIFGMLLIFLLVGLIGITLLSKVPEEKMHRLAAVLFIIAGIWILIDTFLF